MAFTNTDPQNHQGENTWFTPSWVIELFPAFDLDPCSVSFRPFDTAKSHYEYDLSQCGLQRKWFGNVWLNPPYGKEMKPFIDKFIDHKKGVCLIFARTGNENFQKLIKNGAYAFLFRERLKFIKKDLSIDTNAGTDSCLCFFDVSYFKYLKNVKGVLVKEMEF